MSVLRAGAVASLYLGAKNARICKKTHQDSLGAGVGGGEDIYQDAKVWALALEPWTLY